MEKFGLSLASYPSRTEWLEARRQGIGGSDAPIILGLTNKTPLQLWAEKLGLAEEMVETPAMWWGKRLEPIVAEHFGLLTECTLEALGEFTLVRHPSVAPFQFATLDRVITGDERGPGVLEVKTAGSFRSGEWEDDCPPAYFAQVQHQISATGFAWGAICVLLGGQDFRWMPIERNEEYIAYLIRKEEAFWQCVQDQIEPPAEAADNKLINQIHPAPKEAGSLVQLGADALEWDGRRAHAIEIIKEAEQVKDAAEASLKQAIGEAEIGSLPDGTSFHWSTQTRPEHTVKESTFRVLRRKSAKGA